MNIRRPLYAAVAATALAFSLAGPLAPAQATAISGVGGDGCFDPEAAGYVESLARTQSLSLSGKLVYPLATSFFVQWPGATRWRRAQYVGSIL